MKRLAFLVVVGLAGCLEDRIDFTSLQNGVVADSSGGDGSISPGLDGDLAANTDAELNDADEITVDVGQPEISDTGDVVNIMDVADSGPKVDVQDAVLYDVQDVADVVDSGPVVDVQKIDGGPEVADAATTPKCGNLKCEAGETKASCPLDCYPGCGNGVCDPCETMLTCPFDCMLAGPACDAGVGDADVVDVVEDVPDSMSAPECVADGTSDVKSGGSCKGKCGGSSTGCFCDVQCGSSGDCCNDFNYYCGTAPVCGDKVCEYPETPTSCPKDCPQPVPVCDAGVSDADVVQDVDSGTPVDVQPAPDVAAGVGHCGQCNATTPCMAGLTCDVGLSVCKTATEIKNSAMVCDADCKSGNAAGQCAGSGKCTASGGMCIAATDADCKPASTCKVGGYCTANGGKCVQGSDADCKASGNCKAAGYCTFKDGKCGVGGNADCMLSESCTKGAKCTFKDQTHCVVGSDADCKMAAGCKHRGNCTADTVNGFCFAAADADCKNSEICLLYGFCNLWKGKCIKDITAFCQQDDYCLENGTCTNVSGTCKPGADSDCLQSTNCDAYGWCTVQNGLCVAASEADCKKSYVCKNQGWCSPAAAGGTCLAGNKGLCCSLGSDADCKQSNDCLYYGDCTYVIVNGNPVCKYP